MEAAGKLNVNRGKFGFTADGVFWLFDYCGESQFQHSDKRLKIVNSILECLPEKYRRNRLNNTLIGEVSRRKPGTLISPFDICRAPAGTRVLN